MKQLKFKVFGDNMLHMKQVNHEIPTDNRTEKRKLGDQGETIACEFLMKRGFAIIERNYLRKWGEIDIVACETAKDSRRENVLHFIEVKTVTRNLVTYLPALRERAGETHKDCYRPEDNLHPWKLKRLSRAIQTYLMERRCVSRETDWQFDVITVFIDPSNGQSRVEWMENIIL